MKKIKLIIPSMHGPWYPDTVKWFWVLDHVNPKKKQNAIFILYGQEWRLCKDG